MTREEAVKVIDGRFEIMDYCESAKLEEALDIAIKALEQPEPHWIPTSKERPPQHKEIWITSDLGDVELVYGRDDAWLTDVDCYTESEIVAMMPANVPEPYRPEEE